jgi:hypothetical protein
VALGGDAPAGPALLLVLLLALLLTDPAGSVLVVARVRQRGRRGVAGPPERPG